MGRERIERAWPDVGIEDVGRTGSSDRWVCTVCPECSHKRKPHNRTKKVLSVNPALGKWSCNHCGWKGGLGDWVDGDSPAPKRIDKPVMAPPREQTETVYETVELPSRLSDDVLTWFRDERGISESTVHKFAISQGSAYFGGHGKRGAIVFPYFLDGKAVGAKYRTRDKLFKATMGVQLPLFNIDALNEDVTIVVEGEMDAMAFHEAGYPNVVSVPQGAKSAKALERTPERIAGVRRWVLAVDGDNDGKDCESDLARRLGHDRCARVFWPDGCKDANEVLIENGRDGIEALLDGVQWMPVRGMVEENSLRSSVVALYENGIVPGASTGWENLDGLYRVKAGETTMVTGYYGSGKSNFLDSMLVNLAKSEDWRFAFFSPEYRRTERHASRLIEKHAGLPFSDKREWAKMKPEQMRASLDWVMDHFHWMLPDGRDTGMDVSRILQIMRAYIIRTGANGLVIDPWNQVDHDFAGASETIYVSQVMAEISEFAAMHDVHIWVVVHPAKTPRAKDTGKFPVPQLQDASGSMNFANKIDNGLCVYRNPDDPMGPIKVYVQKIRFDENGMVGNCSFKFDRVCRTYVPCADKDFEPVDNTTTWTDAGEGYA